jgi:hypothetical protein
MRVRCRSGALALAVLAGLAAPGLAGEKTAQSGSEGRQRVLRSWESTDKVNGADVYRRMEVVFNYDSGVAQQRAYDAEGRLLSSRTVAQPRPTREEMAEAVAIIEKDPKLGRIVQRAKPVYEGGFLLQEAKGYACGPGTRCLQVQLLTGADRLGLLRWVVVDLTRQAVAYANFGAVERERLTEKYREVGQ